MAVLVVAPNEASCKWWDPTNPPKPVQKNQTKPQDHKATLSATDCRDSTGGMKSGAVPRGGEEVGPQTPPATPSTPSPKGKGRRDLLQRAVRAAQARAGEAAAAGTAGGWPGLLPRTTAQATGAILRAASEAFRRRGARGLAEWARSDELHADAKASLKPTTLHEAAGTLAVFTAATAGLAGATAVVLSVLLAALLCAWSLAGCIAFALVGLCAGLIAFSTGLAALAAGGSAASLWLCAAASLLHTKLGARAVAGLSRGFLAVARVLGLAAAGPDAAAAMNGSAASVRTASPNIFGSVRRATP